MFYWITIWTLRFLFFLFTHFRVHEKERVPKNGAFVLVSNHISHFDPPVFSAACPRAIDWMGSEILFTNMIARLFFLGCRVIKVRQYEADQSALREAIRRVRAGRCVGIFPEGGIRAGEKSILESDIKLYEGALMIAVLTHTPILPCLVIGSDRLYHPRSFLRRPPIWVRFGKPIVVKGEGREEMDRLKQETIEAIRCLAAELSEEGDVQKKDWPQRPQQRNPKIPPPSEIRS